MKHNHHISEEKLIDYILGNLTEQESAQILMHTNLCNRCNHSLASWQKTLQDKQEAHPSISRKEDVWNQIESKRFSNINWTPKLIYGVGSMAALALFIMSFVLLKNIGEDPVDLAHYENQQTEVFLNKPDTRQINIVPVSHINDLDGNIWVNDITNEILIEVDGLADINNRDYQLWIIYTDNDMHGVIIPTQNGVARMFMEDMDVPNFKLIKASVEPKGGSPIPTGPEQFIVEIKK